MDGGPDVFTMSTEAFRALLTGAVALVITLLVWIIRKIGSIAKRQDLVNDLVLGDTERDMPSVLDRFRREKEATEHLRIQQETIAKDVAVIRKEVTDNHGGSLKDSIRRVERELHTHMGEAEAAHHEFENHIRDNRAHG